MVEQGYGLITNRVFRDTALGYHLVFTYDSTQSGTDRNKIYVNGEQKQVILKQMLENTRHKTIIIRSITTILVQ